MVKFRCNSSYDL